MKCDLSVSEDSSMSGNIGRYSLKFRILALVVNTANLINERTTQTLSISQSILAPVTFFTTYIFLGVLALGACYRKYASEFLQIYSLVASCSLQISISILVFNDLKERNKQMSTKDVGMVLNAVLPMFTIMLIVADLIVILFSKREDITIPAGGASQAGTSQTHSITVLPNERRQTVSADRSRSETDSRSVRIQARDTQADMSGPEPGSQRLSK